MTDSTVSSALTLLDSSFAIYCTSVSASVRLPLTSLVALVSGVLVRAGSRAPSTVRVAPHGVLTGSVYGSDPTVVSAMKTLTSDVLNVSEGASTSTVMPGTAETLITRSVTVPAHVPIVPHETVPVTALAPVIIYII